MWNKRFDYIGMIVLAVAGLLFYHHYALWLLLVVMIILAVVSLVAAIKCQHQLAFSVRVPKRFVGKNLPAEVIFSVDNQSFIPIENIRLTTKICHGFYENDEEYEVILSAIPKGIRETKIAISGKYCGRMEICVEKVVFYDLLGLFRFQKSLQQEAEILILPEGVGDCKEVSLASVGQSDEEKTQSKKGDDVSQLLEIRDYIPGDRLSNIHWKLSAKKDELQVKEFGLPFSEEVTLLPELYVNREYPEVFDELIELMYALALKLLNIGRKFQICWKEGAFDFDRREINHLDELNMVIWEFYFAKLQPVNGSSYELYTEIRQEMSGAVLYLSDTDVQIQEGERLQIDSERVKVTWLS